MDIHGIVTALAYTPIHCIDHQRISFDLYHGSSEIDPQKSPAIYLDRCLIESSFSI